MKFGNSFSKYYFNVLKDHFFRRSLILRENDELKSKNFNDAFFNTETNPLLFTTWFELVSWVFSDYFRMVFFTYRILLTGYVLEHLARTPQFVKFIGKWLGKIFFYFFYPVFIFFFGLESLVIYFFSVFKFFSIFFGEFVYGCFRYFSFREVIFSNKPVSWSQLQNHVFTFLVFQYSFFYRIWFYYFWFSVPRYKTLVFTFFRYLSQIFFFWFFLFLVVLLSPVVISLLFIFFINSLVFSVFRWFWDSYFLYFHPKTNFLFFRFYRWVIFFFWFLFVFIKLSMAPVFIYFFFHFFSPFFWGIILGDPTVSAELVWLWYYQIFSFFSDFSWSDRMDSPDFSIFTFLVLMALLFIGSWSFLSFFHMYSNFNQISLVKRQPIEDEVFDLDGFSDAEVWSEVQDWFSTDDAVFPSQFAEEFDDEEFDDVPASWVVAAFPYEYPDEVIFDLYYNYLFDSHPIPEKQASFETTTNFIKTYKRYTTLHPFFQESLFPEKFRLRWASVSFLDDVASIGDLKVGTSNISSRSSFVSNNQSINNSWAKLVFFFYRLGAFIWSQFYRFYPLSEGMQVAKFKSNWKSSQSVGLYLKNFFTYDEVGTYLENPNWSQIKEGYKKRVRDPIQELYRLLNEESEASVFFEDTSLIEEELFQDSSFFFQGDQEDSFELTGLTATVMLPLLFILWYISSAVYGFSDFAVLDYLKDLYWLDFFKMTAPQVPADFFPEFSKFARDELHEQLLGEEFTMSYTELKELYKVATYYDRLSDYFPLIGAFWVYYFNNSATLMRNLFYTRIYEYKFNLLPKHDPQFLRNFLHLDQLPLDYSKYPPDPTMNGQSHFNFNPILTELYVKSIKRASARHRELYSSGNLSIKAPSFYVKNPQTGLVVQKRFPRFKLTVRKAFTGNQVAAFNRKWGHPWWARSFFQPPFDYQTPKPKYFLKNYSGKKKNNSGGVKNSLSRYQLYYPYVAHFTDVWFRTGFPVPFNVQSKSMLRKYRWHSLSYIARYDFFKKNLIMTHRRSKFVHIPFIPDNFTAEDSYPFISPFSFHFDIANSQQYPDQMFTSFQPRWNPHGLKSTSDRWLLSRLEYWNPWQTFFISPTYSFIENDTPQVFLQVFLQRFYRNILFTHANLYRQWEFISFWWDKEWWTYLWWIPYMSYSEERGLFGWTWYRLQSAAYFDYAPLLPPEFFYTSFIQSFSGWSFWFGIIIIFYFFYSQFSRFYRLERMYFWSNLAYVTVVSFLNGVVNFWFLVKSKVFIVFYPFWYILLKVGLVSPVEFKTSNKNFFNYNLIFREFKVLSLSYQEVRLQRLYRSISEEKQAHQAKWGLANSDWPEFLRHKYKEKPPLVFNFKSFSFFDQPSIFSRFEKFSKTSIFNKWFIYKTYFSPTYLDNRSLNRFSVFFNKNKRKTGLLWVLQLTSWSDWYYYQRWYFLQKSQNRWLYDFFRWLARPPFRILSSEFDFFQNKNWFGVSRFGSGYFHPAIFKNMVLGKHESNYDLLEYKTYINFFQTDSDWLTQDLAWWNGGSYFTDNPLTYEYVFDVFGSETSLVDISMAGDSVFFFDSSDYFFPFLTNLVYYDLSDYEFYYSRIGKFFQFVEKSKYSRELLHNFWPSELSYTSTATISYLLRLNYFSSSPGYPQGWAVFFNTFYFYEEHFSWYFGFTKSLFIQKEFIRQHTVNVLKSFKNINDFAFFFVEKTSSQRTYFTVDSLFYYRWFLDLFHGLVDYSFSKYSLSKQLFRVNLFMPVSSFYYWKALVMFSQLYESTEDLNFLYFKGPAEYKFQGFRKFGDFSLNLYDLSLLEPVNFRRFSSFTNNPILYQSFKNKFYKIDDDYDRVNFYKDLTDKIQIVEKNLLALNVSSSLASADEENIFSDKNGFSSETSQNFDSFLMKMVKLYFLNQRRKANGLESLTYSGYDQFLKIFSENQSLSNDWFRGVDFSSVNSNSVDENVSNDFSFFISDFDAGSFLDKLSLNEIVNFEWVGDPITDNMNFSTDLSVVSQIFWLVIQHLRKADTVNHRFFKKSSISSKDGNYTIIFENSFLKYSDNWDYSEANLYEKFQTKLLPSSLVSSFVFDGIPSSFINIKNNFQFINPRGAFYSFQPDFRMSGFPLSEGILSKNSYGLLFQWFNFLFDSKKSVFTFLRDDYLAEELRDYRFFFSFYDFEHTFFFIEPWFNVGDIFSSTIDQKYMDENYWDGLSSLSFEDYTFSTNNRFQVKKLFFASESFYFSFQESLWFKFSFQNLSRLRSNTFFQNFTTNNTIFGSSGISPSPTLSESSVFINNNKLLYSKNLLNLYNPTPFSSLSVHIQNFWLLDRTKFIRFSRFKVE